MYKTVELMLLDIYSAYKHMTQEGVGGGSTQWHTLECEMGSEEDEHSWPFTKHSSSVLATCLTCMPITSGPDNLIAVESQTGYICHCK